MKPAQNYRKFKELTPFTGSFRMNSKYYYYEEDAVFEKESQTIFDMINNATRLQKLAFRVIYITKGNDENTNGKTI